MAPSLVVATLLALDLHPGAAVGLGVGAPFSNASPGPAIEILGFADFPVADKLTAGVALPIGIGFYDQSLGFFGLRVNYVIADIMLGGRAAYVINEWVSAAAYLGLGPSIASWKIQIGNNVSSGTNTYFAMRGALMVEVTPPMVKGLFIGVEPLAMVGRFGNSGNNGTAVFSEYRFTFLVGYRM